MLYVVLEYVGCVDDCAIFAHSICESWASRNPTIGTTKSGEGLGLVIVLAFALKTTKNISSVVRLATK